MYVNAGGTSIFAQQTALDCRLDIALFAIYVVAPKREAESKETKRRKQDGC